jgi:thiamine biosynthesis lipoprotein
MMNQRACNQQAAKSRWLAFLSRCLRPTRLQRRALTLAILAGVLAACGEPAFRDYDGSTMGTYYRVTARCPEDVSGLIERELVAVNQEMSTYIVDSALSRFNAAPVGDWIDVPKPLADVLDAALKLSRESAGAFDVTVGPLVNLWGFGPPDPAKSAAALASVPDSARIAAVRLRVGFGKLEVHADPPRLRKSADLYVDLSAIAKGHGVDRLADRLTGAGCSNLLVDIGGEVRAIGRSPSNRAWRIGVEVPDPDSFGAIQRVIQLEDMAAATSGDYRNFRDLGTERYSHTIDPTTGYPVTHNLASVTVLHPSAMWADGYATALNVLGPAAGFALAERLGLPALFIIREESGFDERYTAPMGKALISAMK